MSEKQGLFGKKLPVAPVENPERASLLPPSAPGACLIHNIYTSQNPTPNCSRCGKPATEAQVMR